jgi:uncharacterized OB-fold protein
VATYGQAGSAPIAIRDADSADYFDALREGVLLLQRCTACGHACRLDALSCPRCHVAGLLHNDASGGGAVASSVVDPAGPGGRTVLALIELDEGPWVAGHILGAHEAIAAGTRVAVEILGPPPESAGEPIAAFRPVGAR